MMNLDDIAKVVIYDYKACLHELHVTYLCYGGLTTTLCTRAFMMGIAAEMIVRGEY